jgi:hypothetical protein
MTLYQQALDIVTQSKDETTIPVPIKLPTFRRHLSVLSAKSKKKFITRRQGDKLFIKQYYEL